MDTIGVRGGASMGMHHRVFIISIVMALNFTLLAARLPIMSTTSQSPGRSLLAETNNTYLDDTVRVDPLDKFKKYRGGYDITSKHYWSSTAFTGVYGYAIALVWLVCGLVYGGYLLVTTNCRKPNKIATSHCHKNCYLQPLLLAVVFTLLAIVGVGLVLGGNGKFHSRAKTVIDIIIDTADEASDTIYNTTGAMKDMSITLGSVNGVSPDYDRATRFLSTTSRTLDAQAANIARQASKNRHMIDKGLNIVYIITTVTISSTLVAVIALLVLGVLKLQRTLQVLIALCWILTVLCWLFFGVYLFLQNFSEDTCTAFESFQHDPFNNSLSSILPCDELFSARSVLNDVSSGIHDLVNEVNDNISTSYGNIVRICNPFSPPPTYEYQPWKCPADSIRIGDIPRVLRLLVCPDSEEGGTCNGGIMVSARDYNRVEAYTSSIQKLLDVYPGMEGLVECRTVENAFTEILEKHCDPLKRYARMVWAALVFLSVVMVASVLVWTIGAHHDRNRHSFGGSIKPHSTTADMLESGTDDTTTQSTV